MSLKISNNEQPKKTKFMPVWIALPLAFLVWEGIPWAVSLLAPRYGWVEDRPNIWNLLGLLPILIGTAGLIWGIILHFTQSPKGINWELDKSYMLKGDPYNISRNAMYLSELTLLFGWVLFYESISILIVFLAWYVFFEYYRVLQEERVLEIHFGEAYREYKNRVPRWFGKVRH